ncbi:hypothetical protein [Pseudescherichia vulneris]|uniref:hypothetical protein n=1 Tax=Pseudescherichia vulneris TaxID=566 RepID=UPI0028B0CF43|nr:hypothetical protein [Pseudescherichia vulneris]
MTLQIVCIDNAGSINNERIVFKVSGGPVATWSYAVLRTRNQTRQAYYFDDENPYAKLKDGDKVYLYSGTGNNCEERNGDQMIFHYFWGLNECLSQGDKITLLEIAKRSDMNV